MILSSMRNQVLHNVGRFGQDQFNSVVDGVINLAVDLLKLNTEIPALLEDLTPISLVSGTQDYAVDSDVDLIIRMSILTSSQEGALTKVNARNVLTKVRTTIDTGTPEFYRPFGATSGVPNIRTYPIYANDPANATLKGEYLPILADLSGSGENLITKRYFNSVIRIATEMAYRAVISHATPPLAEIITVRNIVKAEADFIMLREEKSDYDPTLTADKALRTRRTSRYTQ